MRADLVAQGLIQLAFATPTDGGRQQKRSGLLHGLTVLTGKKFFLTLLFQLKSVISHPPAMHLYEEPGSVFLITFSLLLEAVMSSPGWKSPIPSAEHVLHPLTILVAPFEHTPVYGCFSCPEWPKLDAVF